MNPRVSKSSGNLIARGEAGVLELRAMTLGSGEMPAMDWYRQLDKKGIGQLHAALAIIETSFLSGRAPAGRTELIARSKFKLLEVRVTRPGATPPHLRLFVLRRRMTLYAACGITKKDNELKKRDIDEADRITATWLRLRKEE